MTRRRFDLGVAVEFLLLAGASLRCGARCVAGGLLRTRHSPPAFWYYVDMPPSNERWAAFALLGRRIEVNVATKADAYYDGVKAAHADLRKYDPARHRPECYCLNCDTWRALQRRLAAASEQAA